MRIGRAERHDRKYHALLVADLKKTIVRGGASKTQPVERARWPERNEGKVEVKS